MFRKNPKEKGVMSNKHRAQGACFHTLVNVLANHACLRVIIFSTNLLLWVQNKMIPGEYFSNKSIFSLEARKSRGHKDKQNHLSNLVIYL